MMIEPRFRGCRVIDMTRAQPSGSLGRFLVGQWLPAIERTVRATTFVNYRGHVERHLVPHLGAVPLGELTGTVINKIYADLLVSGKIANRRPLSPTRVRRIHATLHRALRDGSVGGLLVDNPADRCDPPRARADEIGEMCTWDAGQLRHFLEIDRQDRLFALWHVLAMTGMRRGEALALSWRDVDLDEGRLAVRQCLVAVGHEVHVSLPKTVRARRVIALDRSTIEVLGRHADGAGDGFVFTNPGGGFLHPNLVSKAFARSVAASGLPRIRLHDLRHNPRHDRTPCRRPSKDRVGAAWPRDRLLDARRLQSRGSPYAAGGRSAHWATQSLSCITI
jgi:integrase